MCAGHRPRWLMLDDAQGEWQAVFTPLDILHIAGSWAAGHPGVLCCVPSLANSPQRGPRPDQLRFDIATMPVGWAGALQGLDMLRG